VTSIRYLKQKKQAASLFNDNRIVYWDMTTLQRVDSARFPFQIYDYQFSVSENYIISGSPSGIYIMTKYMKILDSIPFANGEYKWKIAISPDTSTFAAGSSDGYLRLFHSAILTDVNEGLSPNQSTLLNNEFTISPDPATDFIEISYPPSIKSGTGGVSVEIYNVFGMKIPPRLTSSATPQEGNLRLDVSSLSHGVYLVRVGEKIGKFVKM